MEKIKVTVPHEVGHAVFALVHPDEKGYEFNGIKGPVFNDTTNYVNSGWLFPSLPLSQYTIRKYQWDMLR